MGSLSGGAGEHVFGDVYSPLFSPFYPLFLLTCLSIPRFFRSCFLFRSMVELAVLEVIHVCLGSGPNGPPAFYLLSLQLCHTTSVAGGGLCNLQEPR